MSTEPRFIPGDGEDQASPLPPFAPAALELLERAQTDVMIATRPGQRVQLPAFTLPPAGPGRSTRAG